VSSAHRNLLNVGNSSERRLRWISYVDEYGPTLHYVEGPLNVIAVTLSRLSRNDIDIDSSALVGKKAASVVSDSESMAGHSSLINSRMPLESSMSPFKKERVKKTKETEKIGTR